MKIFDVVTWVVVLAAEYMLARTLLTYQKLWEQHRGSKEFVRRIVLFAFLLGACTVLIVYLIIGTFF